MVAAALTRSRFVATLPRSYIQNFTRAYTATAPKKAAKNRLYNSSDCSSRYLTTYSVRYEDEFETLNLLSASSRIPLITLWSASWCPSCKVISPLLKELIKEGVGEAQGGVSYAEIELDSPTLGGLAMRYQVNSLPTLLAFDRQEAQLETKVHKVEDMKNRQFLINWIETEAKRHGEGGAGGGSLFGLFGR
ncbi:hypothetical protein E4T52_00991 [Aureobasidium sp. EXF-3400]|nr:hypothetical protein E4T51_06522 [Aureobasidium sp. EXF-12344]KAI4784092.1 hypothetical protein E4T52_00991 [Aureobasidium sp. EXF-3400]